ncbi:conserved Plasmodium protein, unknown function [Plasmodium sp. gorilla clade G2]|uniref:conserved Plasmodium protein, unknown function n=1 Tax=Plasmodium sp. gorilla clade G2 TaxID=880535 RepID=UPI000D208AEB|nr:conserved Plasmodium protein, unknown function [Plasmodium sp. gorilla clade G2]SOV11915.1 conserved Plasmodium protein, unknown function [Plasmodium sp. gorilla clade G2]
MNDYCEYKKNNKKKKFRKKSEIFNESNGTNDTYAAEELSYDEETIVINFNEVIENVEDIRYSNEHENVIDKDLQDNLYDRDNIFLNICLCHFENMNSKVVLRFLADCSSFICAVCLWGVLDDIFHIISNNSYYIKLFYYFLFSIIFTILMCAVNIYSSKYTHRNNCIYNENESQL